MEKERTREELYKKAFLLLLIIFAVFLAVRIYRNNPERNGDAGEYMMQVESWLNHGSMDIRPEDYDTARNAYGEEMTQVLRAWNEGHRYVAANGRAYAPHFGGYALFCVPAKLILRLLGLNQFYCFMITNAILYIAALTVLYLASQISYKKKFYLLLLLAANPAVFYVTWAHPEVFSFSFAVIGLVLYYDKKYKSSIFFVSLGAMQNVPLVLLGMLVGLEYWRDIIQKTLEHKQNGKADVKNTARRLFSVYKFDILKAGLCYTPCLLPIIHTLINFGTINLVATVARENRYLLGKAAAYWLDLNLGILPYMPVVALLFAVTLAANLKKNLWTSLLHVAALAGIYYILSNQRQINSDMAGMMRYNVWVVPILIFYVVIYIDIWRRDRLCYGLLAASAIYTAGISYAALNPGAHYRIYHYLELAPWTKTVLKHAPGLYNPYHGIFISRVTGTEGYATDRPIVYCDDEKHIRKILISRTSDISGIEVRGSHEDRAYFEKQKESLKDKDYQYITIPSERKLVWADNLLQEFDPRNNPYHGGQSYVKGVYPGGGPVSWIGPEAVFGFREEALYDQNLQISFMAYQELFMYAKADDLRLDIFVNDELAGSVNLKDISVGKRVNIVVPKNVIPKTSDGMYVVKLMTSTYFRPAEANLGPDNRKLSLQLYYLGKERGEKDDQ